MDWIKDDVDDYAPGKGVGEACRTLHEYVFRKDEDRYSTQYDDETSVDRHVARTLFYFVVFPIAMLSIPANLAVLWVWSSEPGYNPTTYLFKAQALTDGLHVIFVLVGSSLRASFVRDIVFFAVKRAFIALAVQVTMLLAVARVIKLFSPFHSEKRLSRFRMKLVLAGLVVFNITMTHLWTIAVDGGWITIYCDTYHLVAVFIPATLQMVLMTAVAWRAWRSVRIQPSSSTRRPRVSFQQDRREARRILYTVFTMCVFTFLTYFASAIVLGIIVPHTGLKFYRFGITASFGLIGAINVNVNFVLYYFFLATFKALLIKKFRNMRQNIVSRTSFFSSSPESSSLPEGPTMTHSHNMSITTNSRNETIPLSTAILGYIMCTRRPE